MFCFLVLTLCVENFQKRVFYYGMGENVCSYGGYWADQIQIYVNFNGTSILRLRDSYGMTGCRQDQVLPEKIINPMPHWSLAFNDGILQFDQEIIVEKYISVIMRIILSTTVRSVEYKDQNYDCVIIGDGTEQHFGTIF